MKPNILFLVVAAESDLRLRPSLHAAVCVTTPRNGDYFTHIRACQRLMHAAYTQLLSESTLSGNSSFSKQEWVWEAVHWLCFLQHVATQDHLDLPSAPRPCPFTWLL